MAVLVALFGLTSALAAGCGGHGGDDDDATAGDDDVQGDDDQATTPPATGDDDASAGDDDASAGDDDATGPDPGDDDVSVEPPTPTPVPGPCGPGGIELDGACVADLGEGWIQVKPGGDTVCARGSEFSFFVHSGTVNRLVVGFDGGGACWDTFTCSKANPTFTDSVDESDDPNTQRDGVFDLTNPENPFKDWFAVYIPYCTGDVHWGDQVTH
jgi:hypothetical protein